MSPVPAYQTDRVPIDHESAVAHASATARQRARRIGLPDAVAQRAAVVASELASNIHKHTAGGALLIGGAPGTPGLDLWALDDGPGMGDLDRCLSDGYSTTGTLGAGLGSVRRMASEFAVWSRPGWGTVISARLCDKRAAAPPPSMEATAVCLPAHNEGVTGDGYAVSARTVLVADGLGHGMAAADATVQAVRVFEAWPEQPLPALVTAVHDALRGTRGAAAAVVRAVPDGMEFCGVGNVAGAVLAGGAVRTRLIGQPGTLGYRLPALQPRHYPLAVGETVVLYTDGITGRWLAEADGEVLHQPPGVLVGLLAAGRRRLRDDATVVAVRPIR